MAYYKTAAELYNYDQDSSDDEKIYDDLPSSESEESDDSSVTEESSDEDPVGEKVTADVGKKSAVDVGKMHFIGCMYEDIERIEKEIQELEVECTKVKCPIAQIIMNVHMEVLLRFRGSMQRRLEEVKHVQPEPLKKDIQTLSELKIEANTAEKNENLIPEHVYLQVEGTRIDGYPKKDTDSALGGSFPKQDLKSGDNKQLSSEERTAAEINYQKIQDALLIGDFDELERLLGAKPRGMKKGQVGDGNADLKGGKEKTTADCYIKRNPGTEEDDN